MILNASKGQRTVSFVTKQKQICNGLEGDGGRVTHFVPIDILTVCWNDLVPNRIKYYQTETKDPRRLIEKIKQNNVCDP